jgi:hypothetical protein
MVYQSSHDDSSRELAAAEVLQKIQRACEWDKIKLGESAQKNIRHWQIGHAGLRESVEEHIKIGRKIFQKYDNGIRLEKNFHANVTIYEGKDVYVEMVLTNSICVILRAHEHTLPVSQRLPQ